MKSLLTVALSVYGVTWILVYSHGPANLLARMRNLLGVRYKDGIRYGANPVADLFNCTICLAVWVALPLTWLVLRYELIGYALAAVGFVTLIAEFSNERN